MRTTSGLRMPAMLLIVALTLISGCSSNQTVTDEGFPHLHLRLDGYPERELELDMIAHDLEAVGIDVTLKTDWPSKAELQKKARTDGLDLYAQDFNSSTFHPYTLLGRKLKPDDGDICTRQDKGTTLNTSFYRNDEVKELLNRGLQGQDDDGGRLSYEKIQAILMEDAPWIFGYQPQLVDAAASDVTGYEPAIDGLLHLRSVKRTSGKDALDVGMRVGSIVTLDPANHADRDTEIVIRQIYDGLVTRTPQGEAVLELAESYQSPTGQIYHFRLRQGVKFHDGTELTADDVVYTFDRIRGEVDGKVYPKIDFLAPLHDVRKIGKYEVEFQLKYPFSSWLQMLVHIQIVSKAYVEKLRAEANGNAEATSKLLAQRPMGTGPFKFVKGDLGKEVELARWEGYHGGSLDWKPGPVALNRVTFRMMPDPEARMAALESGAIQFMQRVPVDRIPIYSKASGIEIYSTSGSAINFIEINNCRITDPRVRQALNYAVNWDKIIAQAYNGRAVRVPTAVLPNTFGYSNSIHPWAYSPKKAKELLRAAGYWAPRS